MYDMQISIPTFAQITHTKKFVSLGEVHISYIPTHFWTVLGSCVSVVLHNPRTKLSGVCHAQMVENDIFRRTAQESKSTAVDKDFRFVGTAINYMVNYFLNEGIKKSEIIVSMYGGASLISEFSHKIGDKNIVAALQVLDSHGLRVAEQNVGGFKSRTIRHYSNTGITQVKIL